MPSMIRNTKLTFNFNLDRFFCQELIRNPSTVFFNLLQHLTFQSSSIFISNVYKKWNTLLAMKIVIVYWSRNIHSTNNKFKERIQYTHSTLSHTWYSHFQTDVAGLRGDDFTGVLFEQFGPKQFTWISQCFAVVKPLDCEILNDV